ncbi:MAG: [FeFe] hydrogenase H-cluster maturation GTPase HydF [Clostridiaceae bacterium]|nr:[FeFe] hydrogenase H-cluster maturation GTPase HydF [Clostridiaceae bacterium]
MGLNDTPSANRIHIGFFGRRNAGKSSVVNAVTQQEMSLVSDIKGTTTDPVYKSMELLPLGPVMIIDTPGFDDEGALGELRVKRTKQVLNKTDVAVLVVDTSVGKTETDLELIKLFEEKNINYIVAYNKSDLVENLPAINNDNELYISAKEKTGIHELKEKIASLSVTGQTNLRIVGDLIKPLDFVVLVTPIDSAAPKGRLILPQQQTIRDILDSGATAIVVKEFELADTLKNLGKKPVLVITDSQAFEKVARDTPKDIPMTSFSILMARYKGFLETAVKGVYTIEKLEDGDTILISEGCTHHRQCDDIGSVKIPRWINNYTKKQINFEFSSGMGFPEDLSKYKLIIHCGGCMLNEREVKYRVKCALEQNIPITNYGILIAYLKGILKRSLEIFPHLAIN